MYHSDSFISIIGGGAGGSGVVGYLITWHIWRSTLLVAVVFGVRLPDFLTEAYFGMGWGGGGARLGRGECTSPLCIYLYHFVFQCLTVILIFALSVSACL